MVSMQQRRRRRREEGPGKRRSRQHVRAEDVMVSRAPDARCMPLARAVIHIAAASSRNEIWVTSVIGAKAPAPSRSGQRDCLLCQKNRVFSKYTEICALRPSMSARAAGEGKMLKNDAAGEQDDQGSRTETRYRKADDDHGGWSGANLEPSITPCECRAGSRSR